MTARPWVSLLGSTPPGGSRFHAPDRTPPPSTRASRRGRAATASVPIGAPALSPEPARTTGPYEAEALARAAARRIYRVARPPSRRARPVHAGRPTTCARSRRAAPVMRGLPTSAAVRSRVAAAGRRSIGADECGSDVGSLPGVGDGSAGGRIIGVLKESGDRAAPRCPVAAAADHRGHEPCVPRFGCLAAAPAISRLAPRQARACLCANLWMTCAKARRICAQRGDNGGDSRLAAPLEGPLPARTLSTPRAVAEN